MQDEEISIRFYRAKLVKEHEDVLDKLTRHGHLFQRVIDKLPDNCIQSLYHAGYALTINISGNKQILVASIRALRQLGFKTPTEQIAGETSYMGFFHHESEAIIYLSFTSTACRRVLVGKKMVEEDVYQTVCGENEYPESQAN